MIHQPTITVTCDHLRCGASRVIPGGSPEQACDILEREGWYVEYQNDSIPKVNISICPTHHPANPRT